MTRPSCRASSRAGCARWKWPSLSAGSQNWRPPMLRGLKRRLDKLWDAHQRDKAIRDAAHHRRGARENFLAAVRAGLTRNGIDPASVPAMQPFEPGGVFGPRPEPPSQPLPDSPAARLREKLLRIVQHRSEE